MKILLVRPDGIGDQVLCLPVASALRSLMPGAHITFLSSVYASPVLQHHPDLDAVVTVSGKERFSELVALFRKGFDAAVFLKPFPKLMVAAWAARVSTRVATGYRWYSIFANKRVYEHRHDFSKHESEYNLGILRGLGLTPGRSMQPMLVLTDGEREWARQKLKGTPDPRVIVHPGGISTRRWRAEHYWSLVERLTSEGYGAILTGSIDEGQRFRAEIPRHLVSANRAVDLMGQISLRELMAVIGASSMLVAGSSGPIHLAAGLGCPVVSVFDPRRNQLPIRWQPLGKGIVLRPDVPTCEKCIYEACPYWDCLDRITVDHVLSRIQQVLEHAEPVRVLHV
ncbi:MAG TPA: glycosyltransferase family 9 protein [Burkholderiales bacterium]|nr:glycosyltransferase family 9 protein [Burkholderiales bacterium]